MTLLSSVEQAVLCNLAEVSGQRPYSLSQTYGALSEIEKGIRQVDTQAVYPALLSLKAKGMVTFVNLKSVRLTEVGFDAYEALVPSLLSGIQLALEDEPTYGNRTHLRLVV